MVFNWFRRKYNDSSDTPPEQRPEETPPATEPQSEPAVTPTPAADTTQDSTADLLAFAKSAYKNIQQKQQTSELETAADAGDVETPAETPAMVENTADAGDVETPAETPATAENTADTVDVETPAETPATAENTAVDIETEPPTVSEVTPTALPEVAAAIEESSTTDTESAPSNLSFLERAAAERQAKQERLIASAIEVPEPEVLQPVATTTETAEDVGGLAFDEGFVWSAEVLAAQGRRPEDVSIEEITWLKKLRQGLGKTRRNILNQLKAIVGQGPLNQAAVDEIETALLQADVGVEATDYIINALQKKLLAEVTPPEEAIAYLKQILRDMLDAPLQTAEALSFTP
ncbi:signal recognition particle receptor subunit alpha, partial [Nodularia sp. UHCC 0506]|uniref:signal recognition particle receptor subunit alpha n=1 Tax=Nodularia sp. UHCC 0506 TaxID=3110243 RepID=UPI002B1F2F9C